MATKKTYFDPVDPRVSFPDMEKKWLEHWYEKGIVDKYLHRNDKSEKYFSFLDGPITANNPMGVHHAWGRTYKDLWQRYKNMQGYKQRFQNGFDCQGLWVEVEVEKELGLHTKKDIENLIPGDKKASIDKFINLCKDRVYKFSAIQTQQTQRLGNFMDWDNSYFTMSDDNNYMIWHFLKVCHDKGWIYKGRDSVPWCPRCETAISQHEMLTEDYKEITHKSIYLELPLKDRKGEYLLVWTTTPWTIPANIAVAVDEKLDYALVQGNTGDKYWLAKDRVEAVFGKDYKKIAKTSKGKSLVGLPYDAPFDELPAVIKARDENPKLFHTVVATDTKIMPITTTEGTGLVHTAVSAGAEDFKLGKKYDLPMIPVIADNADYLEGLGFLTGQNAKKHPEIIIDYLKEREDKYKENWLFNVENYTHRYPACWRCKTELVWKVADEWYISMDKVDPNDKKKRTLRKKMMDVAKKITWLPSFGLDRELDWLSNMHDWLISKPNRYWGLALPIYECKKCGNFEVIGGKDELKEKSVEGWNSFEGHSPHKPWIDDVKIKCSKCGEVVERLPDVGNVWLDAGIVSFSTIKKDNQGEPLYKIDREQWQNWFPADFITESFPGQFKNWFYSLIAMSTVLEDTNPFKTVLGFGSLLAEDGRPMHKSWGNAIEFNEGADKIGADVMRWMYARTNPSDNMLFGYRLADETRRQFHLKLWNVYNFFVTYANLVRWVPAKVGWLKLENILDKWIFIRLANTIEVSTKGLDTFDAQSASLEIEKFVDDLSNWYVRRSRDRVGAVQVSKDQDDFLKVMYSILNYLVRIMAPFSPFLAEELFTNLTKLSSVHLADWPKQKDINLLIGSEKEAEQIVDQMKSVREIVELGHAQRKEKQIKVRQPLAKITVTATDLPQEFVELIKDELNIKSVEFISGKEISVELDTDITPQLKAEGEARELVRQIQDERKKIGTSLDELVNVSLPNWPQDFEEDIKSRALVSSLSKGEFKVTRTK